MRQQLSEIPTSGLASRELRAALERIPKLSLSGLEAALAGGKPLTLTSKQTNLAVAYINRSLKAQGLAPITAKELIKENLKPTFSGCLDPCEGTNTVKLLSMLARRFPVTVSLV